MKAKKWMMALVLIALPMLFVACDDDDDYSLDKYWVSIATVKTTNTGSSAYYLLLDDGSTLWPSAQNFLYRPIDGQRVMANYTILGDGDDEDQFDYYVKVNSLSNILTKGVIDLRETNKDSIGDDKVHIEDIWIGSRYLNVIFGYNASGTVTHYINLVKNTTITYPNDGNTYLEFRHNARGDSPVFGARGIVSFDMMSAVPDGATEVTFKIRVNTFYEGEKTYTAVFAVNKIGGYAVLKKMTEESARFSSVPIE